MGPATTGTKEKERLSEEWGTHVHATQNYVASRKLESAISFAALSLFCNINNVLSLFFTHRVNNIDTPHHFLFLLF